MFEIIFVLSFLGDLGISPKIWMNKEVVTIYKPVVSLSNLDLLCYVDWVISNGSTAPRLYSSGGVISTELVRLTNRVDMAWVWIFSAAIKMEYASEGAGQILVLIQLMLHAINHVQ